METSLAILEKTLDDVKESIMIIDRDTFDVIYANKTARASFYNEQNNQNKCYELNAGLNEQCSFCPLRNEDNKEVCIKSNQRIYSVNIKLDQVDDKNIAIEYIKDVTQEKNAKKIYKKQIKSILGRYKDSQLVIYANLTSNHIYSVSGRKDLIKECDSNKSFDENIKKVLNRIKDKYENDKMNKIMSRDSLMEACVQGNTVLEYDAKMLQNDGISHLTLIGANLFIEPINGDTEVIVYTRNIQDVFLEEDRLYRKLNEQQENLIRTENIISTAGIGTWMITLFDDEEPKMYADKKMQELLAIKDDNLTPEEIYQAWYSKIDEKEIPRVLACVDRMRKGEQSEVTYLWNHPELGKIYVRCGGKAEEVQNKGYKLSGYHCYIYEIVEAELNHQKQVKENLQVISAMNDTYAAIYYVDLDKNTYKSFAKNKEYQECTENIENSDSYDGLIDALITNFIDEDKREQVRSNFDREGIKEKLIGLGKYTFRIKISDKIKDYSVFEVKLVACFEEDKHECVMGIQCIDKMLSVEFLKQQRLEEALKEARSADEAKSMFLARMSHDIRTPINGLKGMISIAKEEINDKDKAIQDLDKALNAEKLLESLLNDVLMMSKIEANKFQIVYENENIREIVEEAIEMQQESLTEKKLEIQKEIHIENENVKTSRVALSRILLNVISNAIKYNKQNETIEILLNEEKIDENQSNYIFTISDHGIGMSNNFIRKHLFEPFVQEKQDARTYYSGVGLGMSITKELVDKLNGKIEVESIINVGTTFIITIPMELGAIEKQIEETEEVEFDLTNKKILVAEDNDLNIDIVKYFLESANADVIIAKDGQEAVSIFEESPAHDIDLILMDIMMPNLNGYEATTKIRSLDRIDAKNIPIVAMTANAFEEDKQKALNVGMNEYIAKPIEKNILLEKIEKLLEKEEIKTLSKPKIKKTRKKLQKVVD